METETTSEKPRSAIDAAAAKPVPPINMDTEPEEPGVTTTTRTAASIAPGLTPSLKQEPPAAYSRTPSQAWEVRFSELKTWWYASDKGKNPEMPCDARITRWVRKQRGFRVKGTLLPYRLEMMNSLEDFEWTTIITRRCAPARRWEDSYEALVEYFHIHQHCNIQHNDSANIRLYQWSNVQRQSRNECNLSDERIALLDKLNFNWSHFNEDRWDSCFQLLLDHHKKYGHFRFSQQQQSDKGQEQPQEPENEAAYTIDEVKLGRWANKQRAEANKGMLRADRLKKLKDIGFLWGFDNVVSAKLSNGENITATTTKSAGESVDARLEYECKRNQLRQEGLGPDRLQLQGKRKQQHQEEQQEGKRAPEQASSACARTPKPPPTLSSSSPIDRDSNKAVFNVANVGRAAQSRTTGMHLLSPQDDLRLQLQFQQLQERRRLLQAQHLLLVRLGHPRLQTDVIDRSNGRDEEEEDTNVGEQGRENDEDMPWSKEDDDLLQELHRAQSRVDQLKAKLAKHMSRRCAQQAVAALVPKPRSQRQQQPGSLVRHSEGTVLHHRHQQPRHQRQLEQQQKALLLLQQQQQQQERAQHQQRELMSRDAATAIATTKGLQQQTQPSDSILLAAALLGQRNLESSYR